MDPQGRAGEQARGARDEIRRNMATPSENGGRARLDVLRAPVAGGFFASREQARRAILAGEVSVGTRTAAKPSEPLDEKTVIAVKPTRKYVGRGALKLEPALDHFDIELQGKTALDIGASTGGFTDCMLQRGAEKVY